MRRLPGGYSSLSPQQRHEWYAALSQQILGSHPLAILAIGSVALLVWFVSGDTGKLVATLLLIALGLYRIFIDGPRNFRQTYRTAQRITDEAWEQKGWPSE